MPENELIPEMHSYEEIANFGIPTVWPITGIKQKKLSLKFRLMPAVVTWWL